MSTDPNEYENDAWLRNSPHTSDLMMPAIAEIEIERVRKELARYLFVDADHVELTTDQVRSMEYLALLEFLCADKTHKTRKAA